MIYIPTITLIVILVGIALASFASGYMLCYSKYLNSKQPKRK